MPVLIFTALLAIGMAPIQTSPATQATPQAAAKAPAVSTAAKKEIKGTDAAITIHGLCSGPQSVKIKADPACSTVVTKQQFEVVVNALNAIGPPLLAAQRRAVAEGYATTLLNYEAARKAGVERDPRYAEVMRLARMRAMADMYNAQMQEKSRKVTPEAIEAYYKENIAKFEELTLQRVTLPRYNSANLKDEEFAGKASKIAQGIHDRAVNGEDLDKLQKEVFEELGVKNPPSTKMGPVRRGMYAADQEKQIFALQPGELTAVIEQPSALIIFKLEARATASLEKSKDEISRILTKQNLEKQEQVKNNSYQIDYNEEYTGPAQTSGWMSAGQLNGSPNGHPAVGDSKTSPAKAEVPK
jgi:PPIC-type PPIASE domain